PAELLVGALSAVLLAVPLSLVLAGAAISGPRRTWNQAGLAIGVGLLVGVLLAAARLFVLSADSLTVLLHLGMLLGLACAVAAAVLVVIRDDGTVLSTVLGIVACVLVTLAVPSDA